MQKKVTQESLNALITQVNYAVIIPNKLTHCAITLKNGFIVTGESACIDSANFDEKIGQKIAYDNAFNKLWQLEGYRLTCELAAKRARTVQLKDSNTAEIVYVSPFGKLLIVEQDGNELPAVHWHNADGSFYTDAESPLDICKKEVNE